MNWSEYTILIVEDDAPSRLYFEVILQPTHVRKIYVNNGVDAVTECIVNDSVDFVLMDLKIPRLNGFESARLIRKYRPNIPIIGQSAYAADFIKEKCLKFGCNDFIEKPIVPSELYRLVEEYITVFNRMQAFIDELNPKD